LIGAAAVSDYRAAAPSPRKHKRTAESWSIELVPNPDILAELGRAKGRRIHVGFALESERLLEGARRKLEEKNLDWIVCNSPEAIGAEAADFTILGRDGSRRDLGRLRKEELAAVILDLVEA
ncbi:MAG: bifunctional 4'-phosphopantothenoylcysteine decarboxylase/phosphopantothenoylcysteine synthetase, partial [Planctomycetes bacterium]|nr:bifunctional 4'-phosphopantothenoylcysteine decarboxylase/phosphopantothenoylcysteine synthetase [Planctomycetota bacterium]